MIEIVSPGARTTIQDLGRFGHRHLGVGPAGAFDELAARAANAAVGNGPEAAVLEMTMRAPVLGFVRDAIVAVHGAGFDLEPGAPTEIAAGGVLDLGTATEGIRGYLAIRGGIEVAPVLGSRSTHVASRIGPPMLAAGQQLPVGTRAPHPPRRVGLRSPSGPVRVVGLAASFTGIVDPASDRTGVRLTAEPAMRGEGTDPEPMLPGMIQVPPSGQPIVLGPDTPTTGGYRVIGVVARADLRRVAQARPGERLHFAATDEETAREAWKDALAWIDRST